ncbi:MAG TPA: hypothetical protein V6D48_25090 [Oculatellaceae cyanobacterium]
MVSKYLSLKDFTDMVGGGITSRMVQRYHQLGLLPPAFVLTPPRKIEVRSQKSEVRRKRFSFVVAAILPWRTVLKIGVSKSGEKFSFQRL